MDYTSVVIAGSTFACGAALGMAFAMTKALEAQARAAAVPAPPAAPAPQIVPVAPEPAVKDIESGMRPGFTMAEARQQADDGQATAFKKAPTEVLEELQRGNVRFWTGSATRPEKSAFERRALIGKQFPSTAILSCADSRVPTEIVFDQGLGDMFVVRCAGNAVTETTCGSLQYAVNHLKVKVLMVMGHEGCGAVKAAGLPESALRGEPSELCNCLMALKGGLDFNRLKNIEDTRAHDREAVISNVKHQVVALTRDEGIMKKVNAKELLIVGAFYEISSGIVDFFFEVSGSADLPSKGVETLFDPVKKMERQASGATIVVRQAIAK